MPSDTTEKKHSSNSHGVVNVDVVQVAPQLRPELLMAAKRGDWKRLQDLMAGNHEGGSLVPQVVVDVASAGGDDQHYGPDTVLHAVASAGDNEELLVTATVICSKAKHLLGAHNATGDTPLHCAARAGSIKMVSHLIDLARREEDDDGRGASSSSSRLNLNLKAVLRKQNKQGWTALHEAVRWADGEMVRVLMSADPELARFPRHGTSPLYLAILLGHDKIAVQMYQKDNQLSFSGPDGQNALHVSVLGSKGMTKKLLEWNEGLIKQGDESSGSTPLHFAASWKFESMIENLLGLDSITSTTAKQLLDADESSAYQADHNGSFPIHVAALANNITAARVLLQKCPDCVHLRDAQGRTFLHITAFKGYAILWIHYFLEGNRNDARLAQRFASIMNMQDNEGNTALHLAAKARQLWTLRTLIWHQEVQLNLQNNKGQTALDLAESPRPPWVLSMLDPTMRMRRLLILVGARSGVHRRGGQDLGLLESSGEKREEEKIKENTTTIGVVAVLILTVSFAAAFQLPGGYISTGDNKPPAGTPELAFKYSFQAFVVANNLAAICSAMATICLMYAGTAGANIRTRVYAITLSVFLVNSSARSLAAAFAFGTYAVLAPVARVAVIITWVLTGLVLLDIVLLGSTIAVEQLVFVRRRGIAVTAAGVRFVCLFVSFPFWVLWPYVVIASFIVYLKVHGIH